MLDFSPLLPAAAQQQAGGDTGVTGTAAQTLAIAQTATGTIEVQGAAAQTLAIAQIATGTVEVRGTAAQTLAIAQTAAGTIGNTVTGEAAQTLAIAQTATGTVEVQGAAAQTLALAQTAAGTVAGGPVTGTAAQMLAIAQVAEGRVLITGTAAQYLIIGQVAASAERHATNIFEAVRGAIYDALAIALPTVPIYDHVPNDAAFPFIDLGAVNISPADTYAERGYNLEFYPAVWSQYRGRREVMNILDTMYSALHNARLPLTSGHAVRCRVTAAKAMLDQDGVTYQGAATIEVFAVI